MEILQIVGIALVAALLAGILKITNKNMASLLTVTAGIIIFLLVINQISAVFQVLKDLAEKANISMAYMGTILKIVGIAYIAEFGAQLCRDSGEGTLASKVEFAAKILVLVLAVPIIVAVLQALLKIIPA